MKIVKHITLHRVITFAVIALMLGAAVWRYFAIPAPLLEYHGMTQRLTLEVAGFATDTPFGRQVDVRFLGLPGVLYFRGEHGFSPGHTITANFRVIAERRAGRHFRVSSHDELFPREAPLRLRDRPVILANSIKQRISELYDGDNAAMLSGLLLGDRSDFSAQLQEDLFRAGMSHTAAVSGLHVSLLAGFIAMIFRSRRRAVFVILPIVFLYIAITGFSISAMRAGLMLSIFSLAPFFGREYNPIRALIAAFLALLVLDPYAIFEPAMQLSFSAMLGLLLFASKWQKWLGGKLSELPIPRKIINFFASSLAATFASLVFSLPFAAYWFGGVSLVSPISNMLLLWFVGVIFIGGAASLLLPFIAPIVGFIIQVFRGANSLFSEIPYSVLYTTQIFLLAWLLYGYVMFVIIIVTKRWKLPAILIMSTLILSISLTVWRDGRHNLEITMLDVGQGQSIVVRSGGETLLYDCGGSANAGRITARYLQSRGVNAIDHLVISHYDADHINGIPTLLELIEVRNIYGPVSERVPEDYPVEIIEDIMVFPLGNAEITVIPTRWFGNEHARNINVLVTHQGFSFLGTGDLEHSGERWLMRATGISNVDVLTAGHHGSAGSTADEFLDRLDPKAVLVSSGITNNFGHPTIETQERIFARGIAFYRTDRRGNVYVRR